MTVDGLGGTAVSAQAVTGSLTWVHRATSETFAAHAALTALADAELPDWGVLERALAVVRLARGQPLFHAGAREPHVYFVRDGILRLAYELSCGSQRVKEFVPEGRFFASAVALLGDGRASFSASALTTACVERVEYAVLEALAARHPSWQRVLTRGFQLFGMRKEQRERELLTLDAGQRYRRFVEEDAALAARLPQKEIAAYLGITPVALSRIRRRMRPMADNDHDPDDAGDTHGND